MQSKRKNTIFAVMKPRNLFIGLVFLLAVLTACDATTREARRMVKRAERLADTLPDSTARLIDSVLRMPASFSERERMDMALLQADALFGDPGQEISPIMDDDFFDDHANLSTSPELERAAAYYARKKQYGKAAHAALYSGFVQQHYDEKEAAMRSFKEAEHYGMLATDSLTIAQAQYKMGKMLYNDEMEKDAVTMLLKAFDNFGHYYTGKALTQNLLASCYIILNQCEQAEISLNSSMYCAEKSHIPTLKAHILNNYAVLYRLQKRYDDALMYLRQMVDDSNLNETELFVCYLNLGKTFIAANKIDSALLYFKHVEDLLPNTDIKTESRISAYGALSRFAKQHGDIQAAWQYKELREKLASELLVELQGQAIYRIQRQYDYESLQNAMSEKIISRHRIIIIISALLLVAAIVIMALQHKQKRLMEAEAELKSQIDAMKQDLRQTVKSSVMEKEVALRLRMMLTATHAKKKDKDPNNEWGTLVWQVMNGKDNLFEAAQATIETVYPDLYNIITESHPNLTKTEARLCLLSFTDLSNTEMAEILGLSLNTVNQNRSNLRKKLNLSSDKLKDQLRDELS